MFLGGLTENHGAAAVEQAASIVLGYPARMVTTSKEAMKIADQLSGDKN